MIVLKVGGSLYDLPDLADRLARLIASLNAPDVLLVPGGGDAADAVRALDRVHRLGPHVSHWLALRACSLNGRFLASVLPASVVVDPAAHRGLGVLDSAAFAALDEGRDGCLPHVWEATSDSVAARVAEVAGAELVLLKSVTIPSGVSWDEGARLGHVDPIFPEVVRRSSLRARAVNLRDDSPR